MKINLRKAASLQNAMQELIRNITVDLTVRLNEFQDPVAVLEARAQELTVADSRRNDLLVVLYTIRAQVALANATSGISGALARAAYTDKRIEQLNQMASADAQIDMVVIAGKLDKIRTRKEDSGRSLYREDEVSTGVLPRAAIDRVREIMRDMKKQKQAINDEILELNVRTEIDLSDEVVELLKRENLV
jgi:hypothetical protein